MLYCWEVGCRWVGLGQHAARVCVLRRGVTVQRQNLLNVTFVVSRRAPVDLVNRYTPNVVGEWGAGY